MPPTVQTNEPEREKRPQRTGERRLVGFYLNYNLRSK